MRLKAKLKLTFNFCEFKNLLFFQGLVHLGKGTLTVSPYQYDRAYMSPVAVGGLLATLVAFLDVKQSKSSSSVYFLRYCSGGGGGCYAILKGFVLQTLNNCP